MIQTIASIWLDLSHAPAVVPSTEIFHDLPIDLVEDDDATRESVHRFLAVPLDYEDVDSELSLYEVVHDADVTNLNLVKSVSSAVIKNCILQLNNVIEIYKPVVGHMVVEPFVYKTTTQRFGKESSGLQTYVTGQVYTNFHKMQREIQEVISVLQDRYDNNNVFSICDALETFIDAYYTMKDDELYLVSLVEMRENILKTLQREINYDKNVIWKKLADMDLANREKNRELGDEAAYAMDAIRYIRKWEEARQEQNSIILNSAEENYRSTGYGMIEKMHFEDVVHDSIRSFYEELQEDQTRDIEKWMEKYDKDLEEKELKLIQIRNNLDSMKDQREQLQASFEKRTQEIAKWLEYKRVKEETEKRIALENYAATKIQAWWRGEMVRKKLGPYRRHRKGGKKGKKDKKKKIKK